MKKNEAYYRHLTDLYVNDKCTPDEMQELFAWLKETEANKILLEKIREEFASAMKETPEIEKPLRRLPVPDRRRIPMYRRTWFRYAAVACTALFLAGGYNYFRNQERAPQTQLAQSAAIIKPGSNQATLTLSNGKVIVLDSSLSGNIALTEAATASKQQGKIDFSAINLSPEENNILTTTIQTPAGGQFNIILPDGSEVWLNAASSISFPLQFTGTNRKVTMTGELYYEIAKNTAMPFIVGLPGNNEIEVTGTHFNVMAYDNEEKLKTTLLEGAIRFKNAGNMHPLKPGQQLQTDAGGNTRLLNDVNTQQAIAWKNGLFDFDNVTLPEIMRQIERWYKITTVFNENNNQAHYIGSIKRASSIQQVLQMLELAGDVKFKISEQTVMITKQ